MLFDIYIAIMCILGIIFTLFCCLGLVLGIVSVIMIIKDVYREFKNDKEP